MSESYHTVVGLEFSRLRTEWNLTTTLRYNGRLGKRTLMRYRSTNVIEYGNLPDLSEAELIDSIRHEVSHALHHAERGGMNHSAEWRHYARMVGALPKATTRIEARTFSSSTHEARR